MNMNTQCAHCSVLSDAHTSGAQDCHLHGMELRLCEGLCLPAEPVLGHKGHCQDALAGQALLCNLQPQVPSEGKHPVSVANMLMHVLARHKRGVGLADVLHRMVWHRSAQRHCLVPLAVCQTVCCQCMRMPCTGPYMYRMHIAAGWTMNL